MKTLAVAVALLALASMQGCIPLVVGGYIGYQMSQHDDHTEWCSQHIGDASCHP
jgi:hypothetical protein